MSDLGDATSWGLMHSPEAGSPTRRCSPGGRAKGNPAGDGRGDLVIGAPSRGNTVLCNPTDFGLLVFVVAIGGTETGRLEGNLSTGSLIESALAPTRDIDGDDSPNSLIGSAGGGNKSRLELVGGAPIGSETFGTPCTTASYFPQPEGGDAFLHACRCGTRAIH